MSDQDSQNQNPANQDSANQDSANQDPTAGYRPAPKGPNFLGIVIASGVVIIILMIVAVLVLKHNANQVDPVKRNPTPNSRVLPQRLPELPAANA